MAKRRPKKLAKTGDVTARLRKALAKCSKGELINVIVELAKEDHNVLRRLDARLELDAPPQELVATTRRAIAEATDFDERDMNYNFDYDSEAYDEVKRNLTRLVGMGQLRLAMELSLELMKEGSRQVEASDEGLMTGDIEECLAVVGKPSRSPISHRAKPSHGARRWPSATAWDSSSTGNLGRCETTSRSYNVNSPS